MTWWEEAVFYQIYPRSFNDSDGDGVGDIQGIVEKVDYIDELGVDAVWLNPVYESPQVDYGYDVSDYRAVHDEYGTMEDWEELLNELHDRDIRLIMDLVANHTSDEHSWFIRSRDSDDGYEDYYVWREGEEREGDDGVEQVPPNNWEAAFGGSAWKYDADRAEYYLHLFHEKQPDLNWRNPDVRDEIADVVEWWLGKGVDGFRMDVVNLLSKPDDLPDGNPESDWVGSEHFVDGPRIHEYVGELQERAFEPHDAVTVAEMPDITPDKAERYAEDGVDIVIPFEHMELDRGDTVDWYTTEVDLVELKKVFSRWQEADCWTCLYWNNHDQPRAVSRFGDEGEHRVKSAKMLATLTFTHRGTPFVYQGEEIGMTNPEFESFDEIRDTGTLERAKKAMEKIGVKGFENVRDIVNYWTRDNARTPMQWSGEDGAGFTEPDVEPWIKLTTNYETVNVETARGDDNSVLSYYRELVDTRHENPVLVHGDYELLLEDHPEVYVYERSLSERDDEEDTAGDTGSDRMLVMVNFFDGEPRFSLPDGYEKSLEEVMVSNYDVADETDADTTFELRPYEARVYRVR
ncbi:MAG: alpha-glucosidase [Halobacteriales archaeon]|nr:alpha-glucosidase [Halobacteriales archaeon]